MAQKEKKSAVEKAALIVVILSIIEHILGVIEKILALINNGK